MVCGGRMRGNGHKLKQTGCKEKLDIRTTVGEWSRLPREVVLSLFLEVFKTQLEKALNYLV